MLKVRPQITQILIEPLLLTPAKLGDTAGRSSLALLASPVEETDTDTQSPHSVSCGGEGGGRGDATWREDGRTEPPAFCLALTWNPRAPPSAPMLLPAFGQHIRGTGCQVAAPTPASLTGLGQTETVIL